MNMLPSNGNTRIPHSVLPYVSSLWRQRLENSRVSNSVVIAPSAQCKLRFDSWWGNRFVSSPERLNRFWVPCMGTRDSFRVGKSAGACISPLIPVYSWGYISTSHLLMGSLYIRWVFDWFLGVISSLLILNVLHFYFKYLIRLVLVD